MIRIGSEGSLDPLLWQVLSAHPPLGTLDMYHKARNWSVTPISWLVVSA